MEENNGVGVTDSVSTDAPTEAVQSPVTEEVQTVDAGTQEVPTEPIAAESIDEINLAEGADEAEAASIEKLEPSLAKHLRKVIASKEAEIKRLSSQPQEINQEAVDLYNGLTSFDNERGVPSTKPFAEKLVAKDPTLAYQTVADIANMEVPGDENGWTFGHHFLKANGIDPTRLDDVRSFLEGNQPQMYQEIPEYVPAEYHEAFKNYSPQVRENLEYQLADPDQRQAALELLQDRQWRIDQRKEQERSQVETQARVAREVQTEIETGTVQTYSKFVDDFTTTPTYTNATVSGNPTVDGAIKFSLNQTLLNLAEPDSVAGKQALGYFQTLGINIPLKEIQEQIGMINGAIETSVKAEKGGHSVHKSQADAIKAAALGRLSGLRNQIFAQAIKKMAGEQQQNATQLNNAGLPNFGDSTPINTSQKESTLDYIKRVASRP